MSKLPTLPTPAKLAKLRRALAVAEKPEDIIAIAATAAGAEEAMKRSGFYRIEEIRPVRELVLDARCELGDTLRKMLRAPAGKRRGLRSNATPQNFNDELRRLRLEKKTAIALQRASCLPAPERRKFYKAAEREETLPTFVRLVEEARPYWYSESRKAKHRNIARKAKEQAAPESLGPFPLLYVDPPWTFDTYSEKGLERTPTQHYPTMTDSEIINVRIAGKSMAELASKEAAMFMWCTSANVERALIVMGAWGFEYKAQAVWVKLGPDGKPIAGLGLIFRNQHEVLLYGTRGAMPGPQWQPPSVLMFPRGEHSAKPAEARAFIERMYPDFDEATRLELFSRDSTPGWTHIGYEARREAAE